MEPNVTDLPRNPHREVQARLPWYAKGLLDPVDRAKVDAHLAVCGDCRTELRLEQALAAEMAALPAPPPPDVDQGWNLVRRTLEQESRTAPEPLAARIRRVVADVGAHAGRAFGGGGGWMGVALASQVCVIVVLGAMLQHAARPAPALYHALSSPSATQSAEIAVIFRPDTRERSLRTILNANAARLVGGPTEADAYILAVPAAERPAALARLRGRREVVLAEPLDGAAPR